MNLHPDELFSSVYLEPDGNYEALEELILWNSGLTTDAIYDLLEKLVVAPNLKEICILDSNLIRTFDLSKFNPLKKLNSLSTAWCENLELQYTALDDNESIQELSFHDAKMTFINVSLFKRFPKLQDIDIARNRISGRFDLGVLKNFDNLRKFSIDSNKVRKFRNTSNAKMPKMDSIALSGNKIKLIDFKIFDSFENLTGLHLHNNKLSGTFDLGLLDKLLKLEAFDLSNNKITEIVNSGVGVMPAMLFIELDFNKLTFLDLNDFKNYKNLVQINTAGNPLLSVIGYPLQNHKSKIQERQKKISLHEKPLTGGPRFESSLGPPMALRRPCFSLRSTHCAKSVSLLIQPGQG